MTTAGHNALMRHDHVLTAYLAALRSEVAARTYEKYSLILARAQRQMPHGVVAPSETEIRTWLWGQDCGPAYRAQQDCAIRHLHRWLRRRGISSIDPTEFLSRPKQQRGIPRNVPADQVARILTRAREPVRTWCTIAYYAGARDCEIAGLDRADITEQATRLPGKGGKERMVPTHPALWRKVEPLPAGPVAQLNAKDRANAIGRRISRECDRIGLPDVTAHRLRHTIATDLLDATGDLRLVQDFLGHASPATTAIYTRVSSARMSAAVIALPDLVTSG